MDLKISCEERQKGQVAEPPLLEHVQETSKSRVMMEHRLVL